MGSILRKDDQVYLAGPFFNAEQKAVAIDVANRCVFHNQKHFSPLLAGGGPLQGPDHALEVYERNVLELYRSRVILAQLEWLLPAKHEVRVVEMGELMPGQPIGTFVSPPLNIPDSGTVWEVGWGAAARFLRKLGCGQGEFTIHIDPDLGTECCIRVEEFLSPQIIAYTTAPQSRLNLMLARSCQAYLQGMDAVDQFLATGEIPDSAKKFTGKEQ